MLVWGKYMKLFVHQLSEAMTTCKHQQNVKSHVFQLFSSYFGIILILFLLRLPDYFVVILFYCFLSQICLKITKIDMED